MSNEPLGPLAPELDALIAKEREAYPVDPELKSQVFRHVETAVTLALPPGESAGAGPNASGSAAGPAAAGAKGAAAAIGANKIVGVGLAALALGGALGSGITSAVYESKSPKARDVAPAAETPRPIAPMETPARRETAPRPEPALASPSLSTEAKSPTPDAASKARASRSNLKDEREQLDVARAALARGRAEDAIRAAEAHEKKWPRGALREEREVALIQALVRAGRRAEAEQRANRFKKSFPNSMLRSAVEAALDSAH